MSTVKSHSSKPGGILPVREIIGAFETENPENGLARSWAARHVQAHIRGLAVRSVQRARILAAQGKAPRSRELFKDEPAVLRGPDDGAAPQSTDSQGDTKQVGTEQEGTKQGNVAEGATAESNAVESNAAEGNAAEESPAKLAAVVQLQAAERGAQVRRWQRQQQTAGVEMLKARTRDKNATNAKVKPGQMNTSKGLSLQAISENKIDFAGGHATRSELLGRNAFPSPAAPAAANGAAISSPKMGRAWPGDDEDSEKDDSASVGMLSPRSPRSATSERSDAMSDWSINSSVSNTADLSCADGWAALRGGWMSFNGRTQTYSRTVQLRRRRWLRFRTRVLTLDEAAKVLDVQGLGTMRVLKWETGEARKHELKVFLLPHGGSDASAADSTPSTPREPATPKATPRDVAKATPRELAATDPATGEVAEPVLMRLGRRSALDAFIPHLKAISSC